MKSTALVIAIGENKEEALFPVCRDDEACTARVMEPLRDSAATLGVVFRITDATSCHACGCSI
ncbi:hypothetical protein ACQEVG_32975 [Streptomyces sp. CA-135486]|uniref:hypothetical protein n=1 Tax=Streptomyces sp. CA-135486 TaxID=3240049 RepID=UPI003D943C36